MKKEWIHLAIGGALGVLCLVLSACGSTAAAPIDGGSAPDGGAMLDGGSAPDGGAMADGGTVTDGGMGYHLKIYIKGDATPKTFSDGLSGQTPTNYYLGIQRVDLMTSANDANLVTVFDHGANYVEADMQGETLVGEGDLRNIPAASYTHGRVLLPMARFDIQTTVHVVSPPAIVPGTVHALTALSNVNLDGANRNAGWAKFTFNLGPYVVSTTAVLPAPPSSGGGTIVQENGRTWMVFPLSPPLLVVAGMQTTPKVTVICDIYESFRWQDQNESGYTQGVFDTVSTGGWEPVKNFGATDYRIVQD